MGRIVVLGATGMLGSAVYLTALERRLAVAGTTTSLHQAPPSFRASLTEFRATESDLENVVSGLTDTDYVINCIGLIKHHIDEASVGSRELAISLNAILPHRLDSLARARGFRVIQIATDCVFSGRTGQYSEAAPHDEGDVYGQTKSLGEVPSPHVMHLRASIIGRELRSHRSLIDWVLGQPYRARVTGYADHIWNGVSTVAFARVALGVIAEGNWRAGTFHLVPADMITKSDLLQAIVREFGRRDIHIEPTPTQRPTDRTLIPIDAQWNETLWTSGRYESIPTIVDLVRELAHTQGVRL